MTTLNTVKKQYPVYQFPSKGKLIIPKSVQNKIEQAHKRVGNTEWCGFVFYKKESGTITDPASIVIRVTNLYIMDIGSHSYTESNNNSEDILTMDERIPEYYTDRSGLIHTHHTMATFFSGEDVQELHDSVDKYRNSYYLSLIVNMACDYKARIVYLVDSPERIVEGYTVPVIDEGVASSSFTMDSIKIPASTTMMQFDLDVEIEGLEMSDPIIDIRLNELKASKEAKRLANLPKTFNSAVGYRNYQTSMYGHKEFSNNSFDNSRFFTSKTKDVKSNLEIMKDFLPKFITLDDTFVGNISAAFNSLILLSEEEFQIRLSDWELNTSSYIIDAFDAETVEAQLKVLKDIIQFCQGFKASPTYRNVVTLFIDSLNEEIEQLNEIMMNAEEEIVAHNKQFLEIIE